ncbi:hypothetical protein DV738_g2966, partial [Chaetothyriales sp. CBS 135597]
MSTIDFFGDFCLTCDRQTEGGKNFCSQACRMATLDYYTSSEPSSPLYYEYSSSFHSSSINYGFSLPPAYNFTAHRTPSSSSLSTSSSASTSASAPVTGTQSSKMTEQVKNDLRDYVGLFDHTRTLRRRVSMQSNKSY